MSEIVDDMKRNQQLIENEPSILVVDNLRDVFNAQMEASVRCILFQRQLQGDYDGLAVKLAKTAGYQSKVGINLETLKLSGEIIHMTEGEKLAFRQIYDDLESLPAHNKGLRILAPQGYQPRNLVNAFHRDFGISNGRFLAAYNIAGSDVLRPEDVADTRSPGNAEIYVPKADAQIIRIPVGSIWRQAVNYKGDDGRVYKDGLIHRAPQGLSGVVPRLLLVSYR